MSQHRRAVIRTAGTPAARRHRLLVGAIGVLGASGLVLGGMGIPVLAGDVTAVGNPSASVEVEEGCVSAAAGTGGANGSAAPHQGDPATVEASGQGSAAVTVCPDDLDDPTPDDPADFVSDELDDLVPDDLVPDDLVPGEPGGSLEGEVTGVVTAVLEAAPPVDGDGALPGDLPDGLDDVVPGDGGGSVPDGPGDLTGRLGEFLPDGSGIDAGGLLDRLSDIITGAGVGSGPGGNDGGAPAVNTSTNGSLSGSATVGGVDAERGDPAGLVDGTELGRGGPVLVGTSVSPGGTLPRTGGGFGPGVLRLVALVGLGRGLLGLAKKRR